MALSYIPARFTAFQTCSSPDPFLPSFDRYSSLSFQRSNATDPEEELTTSRVALLCMEIVW